MDVFLPRTDLLVREVDGETVILDRERELIHTLNPTASLIWKTLQRQSSIEGVVEAVMETFEVDSATAARDVTVAVEHFHELCLLQTRHAGESHEQE